VLKKIGFVAAATAAGLAMMGGVATADPNGARGDEPEDGGLYQVGLLTLNNTDVLHNVNLQAGLCDLVHLVDVKDILDNPTIPILTPGDTATANESDDTCAEGSLADGGGSQDN
jgi:hypothetical protein